MYQYTDFDCAFIQSRADQYRDQLTRWQAGELKEDEFRPLRLQNGWYLQRHAPMLRVAVPYGELSSAQVRALSKIAQDYDQPTPELLQRAQAQQDLLAVERRMMTEGQKSLLDVLRREIDITQTQEAWSDALTQVNRSSFVASQVNGGLLSRLGLE